MSRVNKRCPDCGKFWHVEPGPVTYTVSDRCRECREKAKVPGRVCWSCKNFLFEGGSPGYSDATPGYMGSLECREKIFDTRLSDLDVDELRETLTKAEGCHAFDPREAKK